MMYRNGREPFAVVVELKKTVPRLSGLGGNAWHVEWTNANMQIFRALLISCAACSRVIDFFAEVG